MKFSCSWKPSIREKPRRNFREEREQIALFEWASYHKFVYDYLIAIPNGGYRNKAEAARLKRAGVKAGVSDIFFALPVIGYAGLWIELKAPRPNDAAVSKPQAEWLNRMAEKHYVAYIAYGWVDAADMIIEYLKPIPEHVKGKLSSAMH